MSVLVKWTEDWADEFDMTGFRIMSDKHWNSFQEALKLISYPQEMYFGTNEAYNFEDAQDIMSGIEVVENLSDSDLETFEKCFPKVWKDQTEINFGWDPIEQVFESLSQEDYDRLVGQ